MNVCKLIIDKLSVETRRLIPRINTNNIIFQVINQDLQSRIHTITYEKALLITPCMSYIP